MNPVRLASALILRRSLDDPRLFLARRKRRMRFFGDVHAFPGGTVDAVDRCRDAGQQGTVLALKSALVREMIEELALDLRPGAVAGGAVAEADRRALVADPELWVRRADMGRIAAMPDPVLRLVTPEFYPRRYDTWMFLDVLEDRAEPRLLPEELEEGGWDSAAGWLERWEAGEILLAPPTVLTLGALDGVEWHDAPAALAELQADVEGPVPQRIHVQPSVRLVPLRTPTLPPARHTNCYLVGRDPAYIVDPATPYPDERERLGLAVDRAQREGYRFEAILLTHDHEDHVGAVEWLRCRAGLPVWAHAETARRLNGRIEVNRCLADAEVLSLGARGELRCHHTPGHAAGHLCFEVQPERGLLAGDMISTLSSILVHPSDGDMALYMKSLRALTALAPRVVYPAHGPADTRGDLVLYEQVAHRERRKADVLDAVRHGHTDANAIAGSVYGDVPRPMLGHAAASVVSILHQLEAEGAVRMVDGTCVATESEG